MRPPRADIGAPEFPAGAGWIGSKPQRMAALATSGPVLVHFLDFAQLNSVRTLPYVSAWFERYTPHGLSVVGVQAPRFEFGGDPDAVGVGLARLGVRFPVLLDANRALWHDYGCEGWPSLFLWGRGGVLRWFHFGEGEYLSTEEAIQEELRAADPGRELPRPLDPLRPGDAPGARVLPPTPEVFPGGSWERPWRAGTDGEELRLAYDAGGAYATVEGRGALAFLLDGAERSPLRIDGAALYRLAQHTGHEHHELALRPETGLRVWSVSFAAGLPDQPPRSAASNRITADE